MSVIQLNEENFQSEIKNYAGVALIDFYADWCGPCKMVSPVVDEIAEEHPEFKVCKVNVDEASTLASEFSVMSIPTACCHEKWGNRRLAHRTDFQIGDRRHAGKRKQIKTSGQKSRFSAEKRVLSAPLRPYPV